MRNDLAGMVLAMGTWVGGAEAADARLQAVLARLDAGLPVTVVALGGSITTGYAATTPARSGWAAQVAAALARRGPVRFVNAGVSGTDSAAAVQRLQAHVLDEQPDLVLLEFGVNDQWLDPQVRASSYEALLRRLLGAPRAPAVLSLQLTQQGNQARDAVTVQQRLAAHYGITQVDFGAWMQRRVDAGQAQWRTLYDEPVHPNQRGHDAIAQAVAEALQAAGDRARAAAAAAPSAAGSAASGLPAAAAALPPPLHGRAHEFTRLLSGEQLQPWRNRGLVRGGPVHPEWAAMPGGQAPGWVTTADDAEASFLVWGSEIAVFHAESEHYRDLEAWVDDGMPVTLRGHVPERQGYLGWHYTVVGRGLEPGAHLLHLRVKHDRWQGSGRAASLLAVMSAGIFPPALHPSDFQATPALPATQAPSAAPGWQFVAAHDPALRKIGRFGAFTPAGALPLAWSGSEIHARFTGQRLALRLQGTRGGINHFTVEVDGRRHALALRGEGAQDWQLRTPLAPGEHTLRIVKRTEGAMAEADFHGLLLASDARLLAPPPARALRLEFYGDSITAGACNGDIGEDQYEDLSSHDGTRAFGALTAARLDADYVGIAVSGTGITRTWGDVLMPQVWDRVAPRVDAAVAPPDDRAPDVVLINLGQNDHGLPASRGEPFAPDFAARYLAFVRQLRQRYPQARLVLLLGGMSAWREQPELPRTVAASVAQLRAEGDTRIWNHTFEAFAWAHPRIDVHARMADELETFLRQEVLR